MLCTVTEVEETKQKLRMLPIWVATFVPSMMIAQINTLFVKQGPTLNRSMGPHFHIPSASHTGFVTLAMLVFVVLYDRLFFPFARAITRNPRGISLLDCMGVGFFPHIIIMLVVSLNERHRLAVAHRNGIYDAARHVPLTIFETWSSILNIWRRIRAASSAYIVLLPQFVLMGVADSFLEEAKIEFFYDQAPLGTSYTMTNLGVGNFLRSFLLSTTAKVTKRHGHKGWILNNLNVSHLDYYYAFFAVLNVVNFVFFLVVCKRYVYRAELSEEVVAGDRALVKLPCLAVGGRLTMWMINNVYAACLFDGHGT